MADTKIDIELSPQQMVKSLQDLSEQVKKLAVIMEESLGKKAVQNVDKLEKAAEKGSNQISTFFRNMGTRVKEDLKSAFDATGILAGANFAKQMGEGVRSVFEMEKAFDRLNTRLQLTGRNFLDFKKNVGGAVASTGQKLEDVLPGVERISARGNVTNPGQLQAMAGMLAKVRATTGEEVSGLADSVVDILKNQQKEVSAGNVQSVLDTLQSARVRGSFQTAGEAGQAVAGISGYATKLGLSTQQMGGMAAVASHAGPAGQNTLHQFMETASSSEGRTALNKIMGQEVFGKNGKFDAQSLGKVDVNRFGKYSQEAMAEATGMQGSNGADLARFVDAFKNGQKDFSAVIDSFGATQKQFDTATDNFATTIQKFKQKTIEATREVGSGLSAAANSLMKGDVKGAAGGLSSAGSAAWENKETLGGAGALSMGAGLLAGGGINSLLRKIPGAGGMMGGVAGSLAGGAVADATGVQKVYVTNANEIGQGVGGVSGLSSLPGLLGKAGLVGAAGGAGYAIGTGANAVDEATGGYGGKALQWGMSKASQLTGGTGIQSDEEAMEAGRQQFLNSRAAFGQNSSQAEPNKIEQIMENGFNKIANKTRPQLPLTNPSSVERRH